MSNAMKYTPNPIESSDSLARRAAIKAAKIRRDHRRGPNPKHPGKASGAYLGIMSRALREAGHGELVHTWTIWVYGQANEQNREEWVTLDGR
jgi:hypothetical protein